MKLTSLASSLTGDTLTARAFRGTALTMLNFGGAQFLRLVSNLILTRLLFPEAFGLMALVQVVILGITMFSVTGVRTAVIQNRRGDDPGFLNTAWTVQAGRGVLLWILVVAMSAPAARVYDQPMLASLLPVAGLVAVLNGLQSTNFLSANRHLAMGRVTALELSAQTFGIVIMVVLAWLTGSVWALVAGTLVAEAAKTVLSHLVLPGIRNRPAWDRDAFREIFHFGKYIFIGSIAGFLVNNGDRAILGKYVTLSELAVYNIGYFLATVPAKMSQNLAAKVLLPLYSRVADDVGAGMRRKRMIARGLLTGVMLGAALVFAVAGDWLTRLLYTEAYHLAGPITVLIALAYLPAILVVSYSQRLLAAGNARDATLLTVIQAVLQTLILLAGIRMFGLIGAVIAPPLAVALVYPILAWLMRREGAWEPRLDLALLTFCLFGTALALWVNDTAVAQVLAGHAE